MFFATACKRNTLNKHVNFVATTISLCAKISYCQRYSFAFGTAILSLIPKYCQYLCLIKKDKTVQKGKVYIFALIYYI